MKTQPLFLPNPDLVVASLLGKAWGLHSPCCLAPVPGA